MVDATTSLVIFTDLDGTLLDHDSYSWAPAEQVLAELRRRQVPVVLNSSKTLAELAALRAELNLPHPVIAENGAFIEVPADYFSDALPPRIAPPGREDIQRVYVSVKERGQFDCLAFYELGAQGIAQCTGLTAESAHLANQRRATEPVLWNDTPEALEEFRSLIAAAGLQCLRGGRFVHVMGKVDKGSAMQDLMAAYRREHARTKLVCVALGDGPNDVSMLAAADIAVIIPGRHDANIDLGDHACVLRAEHHGPNGWQNAVWKILELLERG